MRAAMDPNLDLALRCAWLSLIGGYTHEEIASRVSTSRVKVTRLIQSAQRAGLVKVSIEGAPARCTALEEALTAAYGLKQCSVAPDLGETGLPLLALGALGAHILQSTIKRDEIAAIGLGRGRTLSACIDAMPLVWRPDIKIVSLIGNLTRDFATKPNDAILRVADRIGAAAYCLAAPFVCATEAERAMFRVQRDLVASQLSGNSATVAIAGVGAIDERNDLVASGAISLTELENLRAAGAVAEFLGAFIDARGRVLDVELARSVITIGPDNLRGIDVVAIAGGLYKTVAITAVLRSGLVCHLVTDERTAEALASSSEPSALHPE